MTTFSHAVEEIPLLHDIGDGLMTRLHYFKTTLPFDNGKLQPRLMDNLDVEKLRKIITKSFPMYPTGVSKTPGLETFESSAPLFIENLRDVYETFLDVMEFKQHVMDTLIDFLSKVKDLQFQTCPYLVQHVLDLLVQYMKVNLVLFNFPDLRTVCVLYAMSVDSIGESKDALHTKFSSLSSYIYAFYENPLRRIQDEFMGSPAKSIASILCSLKEPLQLGKDILISRDDNAFNPVNNLSSLGMPTSKKMYEDLLFLDKMHEWTIYGCLCCPVELANPDLIDVLQIAGMDSYVVHVYRDQVLQFHEILNENFVSKRIPSKLKKTVTSLGKKAVIHSGLVHQKRRGYLLWAGRNIESLLMDVGELVAPKFPMILALLSLLKSEIQWYFLHYRQPIPKMVKAKHFRPSTYAAEDIPQLFFYLDRLRFFLLQNQELVRQYYIDYVQLSHKTRIENLIEKISMDNPQLDPKILVMFEKIVPDMIQVSTCQKHQLLTNWLKLVAHYTCGNFSQATSDFPILCGRMTTTCFHSLLIEHLERTVEEYTDLKQLWGFRDGLFEMYESCLTSESSNYSLHILREMDVFSKNLHPFCPEEQELLGMEMVQLVKNGLQSFGKRFQSLVLSLLQQMEILGGPTSSIKAWNRFQRHQDAKKIVEKPHMEWLPGYESRASSEESISTLISVESNLEKLCQAMRDMTSLSIYDTSLSPRHLIENILLEGFQSYLRSFVQRVPLIERPSMMLAKLRHYFHILQMLSNHLPFSLVDSCREVLMKENTVDKISQIGEIILPENRKVFHQKLMSLTVGDSFIHHLAKWCMDVIENLPPSNGLVGLCISELHQGITRTPDVSKQCLNLEVYLDLWEFQALCRIIGPHGVKILDTTFLSIITTHVSSIQDIAVVNAKVLTELAGCYTDKEKCFAKVKLLQKLNEVAQHAIIIGNALFFRRLLNKALGETIMDYSSLFQESVCIQYHEHLRNPSDWKGIKSFTYDVGSELQVMDESLLFALRGNPDESETLNDRTGWDLLPMLLVASFHCELWKKVSFHPTFDVCSNNAHAIALAAYSLLLVPSQSFLNKPLESEIPVQTKLRNFLHAAATIILQLKSIRKEKSTEQSMHAMFIFMEKFIHEAKELDYKCLESFFPHTLIHNAYVSVSLCTTNKVATDPFRPSDIGSY